MRRLLFIIAIFSFCLGQQTYDSEIQPIWDANCTSCHGSSGNLDLSQGVSYSNIVNVASSGYSGFLLVKPNDPMNSVMHQKIVGNSSFGDRMPKNGTKLSTSDESKIMTWIQNGAPQSWNSSTQSYSFDFGPGARILVDGETIEGKSKWSLEYWVKFHGQSTSSNGTLFFMNNSANENLFLAYVQPNEKTFRIEIKESNTMLFLDTPIDDVFDQNFHHFYMEGDGTKLRLYVDGFEKMAVDFSGNFPSSDKNIEIGLDVDASMDEIRMRGKSGYQGMPTMRYVANPGEEVVLLYQFDEKNDLNITDNSGQNNNGTVGNASAAYEADVYESSGGGGSSLPNTLEIVTRFNGNIGNGDLYVGIWLPGNVLDPDIIYKEENINTPLPNDGWRIKVNDNRIVPNNGPYSAVVIFDKNNNDFPDSDEAFATFDFNTDNEGYAFQDIELLFVGGGGGSGDNLPLNISVNDVPDGINGQMFIEVVRIDQIGETIVKTFQFGEVTPIQNKHMDFLVEGMNNGDNAFIYAQYEDENGEIIADGESNQFNWAPNNDIDIILEPSLYTGPFKAKITVNTNDNELSGYLSFRVFPKGTIIKDELPFFPGTIYSYDSPEFYENTPKDLDLMIDGWLQGIPYGDYPIIAFYDEEGDHEFDAAYEHIGVGFLQVRSGDNMAEAPFSALERLPGPVIQNSGLKDVTVNAGEELMVTVNINKSNHPLSGELDMVHLIFASGDRMINDSDQCDNLSPGVYDCSVPSNYVTNKGLVIGLDAWDEYGAFSSEGPYDVAVQFDSMMVASFATEKYVMISVPAKINNPSTQAVFVEQLGDPDPSLWRTFKWKNGAYQENSGSLTPGSAVWLISKDVNKIYARNGHSTQLTMGFQINLSDGWNQIGSPYNFPIDINDDFFVNVTSEVEQELYQYTGNDNYSQTSVMNPGSGYWIYSNGNGQININTIFGFPPLTEKAQSTLAKQNLGWEANLEVSVGDQRDRSTHFGVHPNAKLAYDKYDFHEPPVIGEYVSAYFKHSEAGNLNQDIQNDGEVFYSWPLAIQTNQAGIAEVVIPNINEIPYEHSVKLFDPVTQIVHDMRQNSSFKFASQGTENPHYFELMIGKDEFINDELEKIGFVPNKFELAQNIPNPFNPVTNILVSLKEDATISLKVFNLLGEEINSIAMNQPMNKGNHRFLWSGKSDNGNPLPSGIYLYRLEVLSNNGNPVYQNTKKMILMK